MGIEFKNVSKTFGGTCVVDDLSLKIDDGEFIVLLGPSGCGKTTTLRMLAGLESVTSGDILIDGERVNDIPTQHRDLAMVFQSYALYPHMTIAENIGYPLRVRKLDKTERNARVRRVVLPLALPGLISTGVFAFNHAWNEFLFALVLTQTDAAMTLPVGIAGRVTQYEIKWGVMSAAASVAIIPILVFALSVQKYLVRGLSMGAVKG